MRRWLCRYPQPLGMAFEYLANLSVKFDYRAHARRSRRKPSTLTTSGQALFTLENLCQTQHSNLGRRSAAVAVWRNADVFNVDILKPALGTGKAYKGCDPIRC